MNEVQLSKQILRKTIRLLSKSFTPAQRQEESSIIWDKLQASAFFANAQNILLYWSMESEVETRAIIERIYNEKKVFLPVVVGENLVIRQYCGMANMLAEPIFGILEPVGADFENWGDIDLVIVPGLAFDSCGNRMGRGKGYYDKLLFSLPNATKIGICYTYQLVENVPVENHDIKLNGVFTAKNSFIP